MSGTDSGDTTAGRETVPPQPASAPDSGGGSRARPAGGPEAAHHPAADRTDRANRRYMPPDFSIALRPGNGADAPGYPVGERRHPMRGFEDTYSDIVDYIVRITHRIWEDQDVGYVYDTYAPGCRLHDDSGLKVGVEPLVTGTIANIHAFPDCRHYADEVIWAGDDRDGFVTSHRAQNTGTHTGDWQWGPATGKPLRTWVMANCEVVENEITEEWVLYNTAAKLDQLGIDVREAARAFGNEGGLSPLTDRQLGDVDRLTGGRKPLPYPRRADGAGFDPDHLVRALYHDVYNRRDLSAVDRAYAPHVRWYGPTNRTGYGRADVRGMARGLLATFPDLGHQVDEVYWMGNEADGYRVSVRWTAVGTHRGHALYGRPTGRRVHLWGLTQLYLSQGRITEEWTLFNEFDVLAQLLRDDPADRLV
ncbi:ester cyclase [Streptomyces tubbatahanensis]|uniref:Ester cyclase n=1 Tax=Streptomyces tubbatahanensis TaxID=2923272 RepID=A0ABY3XMG4_9ACTN|nr:ester cyclase [Streptomyces tubbatahanensis]UNS95575.1 ester cyclase [Streptomyces tubbatahanensis]